MPKSKILIIVGAFLAALILVLVIPSKGKKTALEEPMSRAPAQVEICEEDEEPASEIANALPSRLIPLSSDSELPKDVNVISKLFQPFPPILPFIETVSYSTRVSWLSGRQAYIGDYASYFNTSKHFISRSLNGEGNYFSEKVRLGDRFNVIKKEVPLQFHLVVDLSRLKLWFYAYDGDADVRYLLKTYRVAAGRLAPSQVSGCLTPLGIFSIGRDSAIYKEGVLGTWRNEPREMITIFGVRWIGFGKEIADCTGSCKGLGFHGVPWKHTESGDLVECRECIGNYVSGGCIRLFSEDIEEIYAIITSRPSFVHIVSDFTLAQLPGRENPSL